MKLNQEELRKFAVKDQGISGNTFDQYAQFMNGSGAQNMTPYIIEERPTRFAQIDVFSRLIMDRIIFMGTPVTDEVSNIIVAQLLFLQSVDPTRDISLYINSPGGSVTAGLAMYDTMHFITPDVATICTGIAASMGAVLLAGGAAGKRTALPHSRVMIHQPSGGMQGTSADMEISFNLIMKMKKELYDILASHCGKTYEQIEKDSDRDFWMSANEAKEYGAIDEVLGRNENKK